MLWILLACDPVVVAVDFEAVLEGVDGLPWGISADQVGATATGSFWYDATTGDQSGADEAYGLYNAGGMGGFSLELEGVVVEGSNTPAVETWNTTGDHFYFIDGDDPPMLGLYEDAQTGVLTVDGEEDPALTLRLSFLDETGTAVDDDGLHDPFPFTVEAERGLSLETEGGSVWLELTAL